LEHSSVTISKNGINRMFVWQAYAVGDIKHRLWTIYWLARMTQQTGVIVELGVRQGDSTRALLSACEDCGSALWSYDTEPCKEVVERLTTSWGIPWFTADWWFFQSDSIKAGEVWPEGTPIDMIFLDTDHTFETTRKEIAVWSPHVRPGGCIAFHDYWLHDPPRDENQGHGVKMAVDEWANNHPDTWALETHDAGPDGDSGFAILWKG
jgi:predicted O-methyltransferase YrrM